MKKIILRSFKKMPQGKLNSFATIIATRMAENTLFSTFKPQVDELKALNDAFTTALANASNGGREFTAIKDRCMIAVVEQLDNLADDVDKLAKGDEVIVFAAGFEVRKTPEPIDELSTPKNFTLLNAPKTGEIKAKWKAQGGVVNYAIEYQIKGEQEWKNSTYTTSSEIILKGFEMGTYVSVKVCGIGRKGLKSDFTEPATVLVL